MNEKYKSSYNKIFGNLKTPPFFYQYSIYVMHLDKQIKFGNYKFENTAVSKVLDDISKGKSYNIKITFPEGFTVYDIAVKADKLKNISKDKIIELSKDKDFIKEVLEKDYSSLEGFLYPDTYFLSPDSNEKVLIKAMIKNFFNNLPDDFEKKLKEHGLNFYQGLILASVVQKETYKDEEYPVVASVFLNRLKRKMKLQSDPTVIYGIKDFNGNIKRSHLKDEKNPYNTYVHPGLPPTPVCNPSKKAILAVMNPAKTKYLYFVADKKGNHIFAKTYLKHKENVRKFQLRRK